MYWIKLILSSNHVGFILLCSEVLTTSLAKKDNNISCIGCISVRHIGSIPRWPKHCALWQCNTERFSYMWGIWIRLHILAWRKAFSTNRAGDLTAASESSRGSKILWCILGHCVTRDEGACLSPGKKKIKKKISEAYLLNLQKGWSRPGMRTGKGKSFCYSDPSH